MSKATSNVLHLAPAKRRRRFPKGHIADVTALPHGDQISNAHAVIDERISRGDRGVILAYVDKVGNTRIATFGTVTRGEATYAGAQLLFAGNE